MAQQATIDAEGNIIPDDGGGFDFWNPDPATAGTITGGSSTQLTQEQADAFKTGSVASPQQATTQPGTAPAPAPATSAPQLPEFGMGSMNMPPAPTFDQPSYQSLTQPSNGLSADDQAVRSGAASIFGSDPGAPGGKYSGGAGRRSNPLRESEIGKRFMGASKAGTAYGNAFDKEGLTGGGKNAQLAGGDNADLGGDQSDLLLQLLQLLGQG